MTMQKVNGTSGNSSSVVERVVAMGDLEGLQPAERVNYYRRICDDLGLNPLTQPFMYVKLNGKLTLYAKKDASDQLRKLNQISIEVVKRERVDDIYIVTARATTPSGRADESIGAVSVGGLKGESLANALMKAETKAKRRVTLSICGLGWLDETEVADVRAAKPVTVTKDGEIVEEASVPDLTKQLGDSIDWAKWEETHANALRSAKEPGDLMEAWALVNEEIKKLHPAPKHVEALRFLKDIKKAELANK